MAKKRAAPEPAVLTGWAAIAKFLGQPVVVAQRWAKEGMPVQRKGRYMTAAPDELSRWLGKESGAREAIHITQGSDSDLLQNLRRGLKQARAEKNRRR
ncbi:MAG: hypothetical protein DMG63_17580 [Acidobacteria bacterium]|nr:MAG: hypothetical protein DMG63_17580 [Acidobacteriota bacterium]